MLDKSSNDVSTRYTHIVKGLVHYYRNWYCNGREARLGDVEGGEGREQGQLRACTMLCFCFNNARRLNISQLRQNVCLARFPRVDWKLSITLPPETHPATGMSRGGGRGGRGGRGGGRGGFGFGGANNPLPMGLTPADVQNLSREATALYPVCCCTHFPRNVLID